MDALEITDRRLPFLYLAYDLLYGLQLDAQNLLWTAGIQQEDPLIPPL